MMIAEKRKLNKRLKDGFSLIELIIAIAILAIFVGVISLSVGLLRSGDTKGLASHINDAFTDLKAVTEAHTGPYYLHLYKADGGYYRLYDSNKTFSAPSTPESSDRLGPDTMSIDVVKDTGITGTPVLLGTLGNSGCESLTFAIRKKDGSYNKDEFYVVNDAKPDDFPVSFDVKRGTASDSPVEYKVILAQRTGLHYLEQQ